MPAHSTRALTAQNTTVVFGAVRLMDGSLPRSLDPLMNLNAFATVNLLDSAGNTLAKNGLNLSRAHMAHLTFRHVRSEVKCDARVEQLLRIAGEGTMTPTVESSPTWIGI